ncbi:hypothetical protein TRFO_42400 [Tritrichomonas foetus]|uniref:Uncharacterized protein n=1 Tax=Tritrichomonas foetus TaxID=1144522 RepID=A0A1J4L1A2_9EUKA|nr:hypothetical protein TRFO_42400 [Tritrichomonas foetus]|eukprot:OHT15661.1 hypothetical protein TRFO_42400 [Tritrichomonas foetus]
MFAYLSGTVLQRAATPILANFNPPMISLHRIAHLTYTVLSDNPTKFPNNCGYILQFLGFINELCVCNFYEKICCENVQFEATQNWLVDMNFSLLIANELTKTYPITEYEYYDYSIQRIRHLYLIIRICLSSSILRPSFLIDELFDSMTRTMLRGNFVDSIENERWEVLCLFYGDDTTELFRNIFGTIFNVVSDSITCVKRYHVAALTLLTLMLRKDRHIRPFLYSFNIHEVLLRLLLQFPDHTFLHNAIIRFFKEALAFPEFSKSLIENLLNPLVLEGVNSEHTVLVGTSYECISLVLAEAKTNTDLINVLKDIPEFVKFVKDVVVDRIKLIKNGYGGRIQSIWG